MSILVISTGGTIAALPYDDPAHPPRVSLMPGGGRDFVREALARFADIDMRYAALPPRDSKNIDDAYRLGMLALIEEAEGKGVVITHGTDTLLATADFIYRERARRPALTAKNILLTGAMVPLANGAESEGARNLAAALQYLIEPGLAPHLGVVLCDFNEKGLWRPRLYVYEPERFEKFYADDGRYHRLREVKAE